LSNDLVELAKDRNILVQQAIYQNYGSDGAALMKRGTEVARYTHSPIETVDEDDLRACVELVVAFATSQATN
jgi:putative aminopeptidase FrvX